MPNEQSTMQFDHREIAVIFSLFVFVSLLMFTVGIVVGKGLSPRYASAPAPTTEHEATPAEEHHSASEPVAHGTSVSTPEHTAPAPAPEPAHAETKVETHAPVEAPVVEKPPLELVPQKSGAMTNQRFQEPKGNTTPDDLIKNPKIQSLIDDSSAVPVKEPVREPAAIRKPVVTKLAPASYAHGPFTVQVNSYPTQKDAADRVETLKKLGYAHAYFTSKEIGNNKETWYRVWLGYFPDHEGAQAGGRFLQSQGEVKNYLVRTSNAEG